MLTANFAEHDCIAGSYKFQDLPPKKWWVGVTISRRSAAGRCATAHPDARSPGGGQDDQVDVRFGQDLEVDRRLQR